MFTTEQRKEFEEIVKPLIKWINDNGNPHTTIFVDCDSGVVSGAEMSIITKEYLKD